jgi:uncharacterized protein YkwD
MTHARTVLVVLLLLPAWLVPLRAEDKAKEKEPAKLELSDDEKKLLELINKEREKAKLPTLETSRVLFQLARDHSANMVKKGEMNHVLDGKGPAERAKDAGYEYLKIAENIAQGEEVKLEDVVKGWMESKLHRENILNKDLTETGIGIKRTDKGEVYYTQVFGTPRKKK